MKDFSVLKYNNVIDGELRDLKANILYLVTNIQEDIENTTDLMASYIDGVNTDLNKDKLKTLMNSLYNDALAMEIQ